MSTDRQSRFSTRAPLQETKHVANRFQCDVAAPNGPGIGNVLCYTRLIEDMALSMGRQLRLATAPLDPKAGARSTLHPYPLWEHNPYIADIINLEAVDPQALAMVNGEKDDLCQFSHVIENLCGSYGLRPRALRGSLFLAVDEMRTALGALGHLRRPIVAIHPYGKTASPEGSPWYLTSWQRLIAARPTVSFFQLGADSEKKPLGIHYPHADLRAAIALIWAADLFVGFDSGLAHIATALQKPTLVLWDAVYKEPIEAAKEPGFAASLLLRWAYPQNRNLLILGERFDETVTLCLEFIDETISSFKRQV